MSSIAAMKLSIIVPAYNEEKLLPATLAAIREAAVAFVREGDFPLRRHIGVYGFARDVLLRVNCWSSWGACNNYTLEVGNV
jgi:CMP-2-keto-3-deoxyoctulosonic acid synthetase